MTYLATVYNVFIASPGDAQELREVAEEVIVDWNHEHSYDKKVVLLPLLWEKDSAPGNERGQDIINESCVDKSDLVVAIWRYHIGLGTLEEVTRSLGSAKQVLQYFSTENIPRRFLDSEEENAKVQQLTQLKRQMQKKGAPYYAEYDSPQTFRESLRRHLVQKINELDSNSYAQKHALLPAASKILRADSSSPVAGYVRRDRKHSSTSSPSQDNNPQSTRPRFNTIRRKAEEEDFAEAIESVKRVPDAQNILKALWEHFSAVRPNKYFTVGRFIDVGPFGKSEISGVKINKKVYFHSISLSCLENIMSLLCANNLCALVGYSSPPNEGKRYRLTRFFIQNAPNHNNFKCAQQSLFDL